ncbi:3-deoxy-D-manno-octulosonic acid transferase [Aquicella siphonis]|uniref:3-deoxy-D-manno-octulosonic acid transferase n=1 Tax=Aquicella siphonis TaxID=254247 RepID=A0A5E4PEV5_9COXI|nr:lipid IV(A) 3-deoxy-D-manno-octulosonic acid transferase [Aquicella siphonis]VVC75042.1 3-deoxy-D-manno-octulosonic acid transferase [Aquicella siphonis]
MRYLYTFLFYLALPFVFLRLWWKSRNQPEYRERLGERLGYYPFRLEKCIWVHAVSVGETLAAIPLIKGLKARYPHVPLLVTTMTPTGAERVKSAFGDSVKHAYIPYDLPGAMQRFIATMHPVVCVIMETELWPNLLAACSRRKIPVCLVNARLSEKSAKGYGRIASLAREMLRRIDLIAAHGQADAERFVALGAYRERMITTGNIKFDIELPQDLQERSASLRAEMGGARFVWIAASTHEGEEEIILAAHELIRAQNPSALLILVPRHPARFDAIAHLAAQMFMTARRSRQEKCTPDTAVYLGDTMGELLLMYGASDVAFVAGSLIPRGGHNMLEPGALGKPILTGPHLFNFAEISELFVAANALNKVTDAQSLAEGLMNLMRHPQEREQMGARALQVISRNRGALSKQIELVSSAISSQLIR